MRKIPPARLLDASARVRLGTLAATALAALLATSGQARAGGPGEDELPTVDEALEPVTTDPVGEDPAPAPAPADSAEAAPVDVDTEDADEPVEQDDEGDEVEDEPRPPPKSHASAKASGKSKGAKAKPAPAVPRPKKSKLCAYRTPLHEHVVARGEHLGSIAGRYGVLRKDLIELNPELQDPDLIRPGQTLKVCPELAPRNRREVVYEVKAGDNLLSIAKTHELTLEELLAQQPQAFSDPNLIRPGQKIVVEVDGDILPGFEPEVERSYDHGSLHSSHHLPKGVGYAIKRPHLAFGTKSTITAIQSALDRYHRRANGGPLVHVGDISREGGGPLKGHVSHQRGVDVDIGLVLKGDKKNDLRFHGATEKNLDVRRTWILVHEFLETGQVRYIFLDYRLQKLLYDYAKKSGVSQAELDEYFQYPRGRGRNYGIVRHWKGHRNHIHVRFRR